tara:strand:- start:98 stop:748 length:651 start_codon:yes stop_codon:yes gene_type:complete
MYNRLLTVVYDPGLGGEFLAWILGQNESYVPTSVYVNSNNRWRMVDGKSTPFHVIDEWNGEATIDQSQFHFHPDQINISRDHMFYFHPDTEWDDKLVKKFVNDKCDIWNESCIIVLRSLTLESHEYFKNIRNKKLNLGNALRPSFDDMNERLDRQLHVLDEVDVLVIDPYDLFITNTTTTMKEISVWSEKIFGINAVIDIDTMKFFINIWRSNNII